MGSQRVGHDWATSLSLWTARRSNQSILKEINPEYLLEGLILKLKLQYFGPLIQRANLLGKTLMLGKIEGKRRGGGRGWDGWIASVTQWTWIWANSVRYWRTGKPGMLLSMGLQRIRHNLVTEQQQLYQSMLYWSGTTKMIFIFTLYLDIFMIIPY